MGYLASYLAQRGYKDVDIHVAAFETDETIIDRARLCDVVGFTATSPMMKHARELARQIKSVHPQAFIVFGGVHSTVLPQNTLKDPSVDVAVRGEGEETFFQIVQSVVQRRPLDSIKGISWRDGSGLIRHNRDGALIENIDTIPFPARRLMAQERFLEIGQQKYGDRGAWVFSSRGCPFRCTYCASHQAWTRLWRARTPANIIQEIDGLIHDFKADRINFADDTFTISRKRVAAFCELLQEKDWPITWGCNIRVDTVDRDILETMSRSGCTDVWIGVESGSPTILREIKKGINPDQIKKVFRWAREVGLKRRAYLMLGAPSESKETIRETERLVEEIQPDVLAFSILTPYPGCEDYERALALGYVNEDNDWSGVDLFQGDGAMMDTRYLTREELEEEHRRLSVKFKELQKK
ncbi:MAG: radical SAM protein [Chloroflexi bacterium]|nr:radical SAM protein [Chloroflexota bacterium]